MAVPKASPVVQLSGLSTSLEPRVPLRRPAALLCLLALLGSAAAARAQVTINVPTDQPTIQAGINAANNGDTVLVAPGLYNETIDFKGKAITVESSAGPNSTAISWAYPPTHADPFYAFVVTFQSNETRSSVLKGFTITGGGLPFNDFQTTVFEGLSVVSQGQVTGGIEVLNGATPSIVGNIVTNNGCAGIFSSGSAPLIQNNEISDTTYPTFTYLVGTPGYNACFAGQSLSSFGPPIFPDYGYPGTAIWLGFNPTGTAPPVPAVVSGNTIENNTFGAYYPGLPVGTIDAYFQSRSAPSSADWQGLYYVIENNIVRNNVTNGYGGGMFIDAPGIVAQNLVYGNKSAYAAGGVWCKCPSSAPDYGPPTVLFVNNTVANDTATLDSSEITVTEPSQLEFANNIVVGISSLPAFAVLGNSSATQPPPYAVFDHNDIFNSIGQAFNGNGVVPDPTGAYGNISADPLFIDAASGEYQLQAGSPAIDAGNTSALQQLANLGFPLSTDLDSNPRVQDATVTGYPIVDMGPYEYVGNQESGPTTILLTPAWYEPYGQTELPLTAQLISPNGTPTGKVTFYVNGASIGTATIDGNGVATINTPPLALGQTALLATYSGQGDFAPAVSVEVLIFVQPDNATLTLTSAPNPSALGSPVTFTATIVSTSNGMPAGDIQFTDNGNPLGTATLDADGVATFITSSLTVGSHTIVATYPGGVNWGGASASVIQIVLYTVQETLTSSLNPSNRDQAVTFTATVSSPYGTPTGTIVFSNGGVALGTAPLTNGTASFTTSTLPQGSDTITAAYSGDSQFFSSSASLIQVVIGFLTTTTINSITPAKLYALEPAIITATVTGLGGTPTGNVTFTNAGVSIGTATLNAAGTAALTYAFPTSGNQQVIATYNGDINYAPSVSAPDPIDVLINDSETALTVAPTPVFVFHPITLTATVSSVSASAFGVAPYGTVNFLDGAVVLAAAPLNASGVSTLSYTFTQVGNQNLTAVYPGNVAFQPSQSASQLIAVQPSPTATAVTANINPQEIGSPVTFTATVTAPGATATPVGTVTFLDNGNSIGVATLDATGTATFTTSALALGQHPITASFTSSSVDYLPSLSPVYTETIVIALGDFTITVSPTSQSIYTGQVTQAIAVTLVSSGGWNRNVTLSCGQLPANTTCAFTQTAIANANGVSQLVIQTKAPSQITASPSANNYRWPRKVGTALAALALIFIPFAIPFRRRSAWLRRILSLFALAASLGVMSGCGAPNDAGGTPAGIYNIAIDATFSGYGATLTHGASFTLTVQSLF